MDRRIKNADKKHHVNSLLFLIGLRDRMYTKISHLSGGERKRLSLAEEVIILFGVIIVLANICFSSFFLSFSMTRHLFFVMSQQRALIATVPTV